MDPRVGPTTASATITITTAVVGGTKVIAAAIQAKLTSASSAKTARCVGLRLGFRV